MLTVECKVHFEIGRKSRKKLEVGDTPPELRERSRNDATDELTMNPGRSIFRGSFVPPGFARVCARFGSRRRTKRAPS